MASTAVSSSCVGVCEYCEHEGEGWRSEADCFYCEACWAAYDAQLPKDMLEYPGMSLHDEIINSVQQEGDDEGAGRSAEWLDVQYQKMQSQPIPPIEEHGSSQADAAAGSGEDGSDEEAEDEPVAPLRTPVGKQEAPAAAHIILLIDTSGSMRTMDMEPQDEAGGHLTRIAAVHEALRTLLAQQRVGSPGDIFSLVSFNDRSTVHFAACPACWAKRSVSSQQIPVAKHGTTFEVGLDTVAELVDRFSGARTTHLVVLSDGRPASAERTLQRAQALLADQPHLHIHAIGFGGSLHSFDLLQQLTSISGGMFAASSLSLSALKFAMSSVSSTITETQTHSSAFSFEAAAGAKGQPQKAVSPELRVVNFEPAVKPHFTKSCATLDVDSCAARQSMHNKISPFVDYKTDREVPDPLFVTRALSSHGVFQRPRLQDQDNSPRIKVLKGKKDTERSTETSLPSRGAASLCGGAAGSPCLELEHENEAENEAGNGSGAAGTTRSPRTCGDGAARQRPAAVPPLTEAPEAADAAPSTFAAASSAPTLASEPAATAEAMPAAPVAAAASVVAPPVAAAATSAAQNPVEAAPRAGAATRAVVYMRGQRKHSFEGTEPGTIGEEIAKVFGIPPDEQHLLQEAGAADGAAFFCLERKMDARRLHFTQAQISPTFRNGQHLFQLLNEINNGGFDPLRELDPLDVVHFDGKWWSMDNRRLWVLKHSDAVFTGGAMWVRVNVQKLDSRFRERYTTSNGGIAVCITGSRSRSPTSRGRISDTTTVSSFQ